MMLASVVLFLLVAVIGLVFAIMWTNRLSDIHAETKRTNELLARMLDTNKSV